jgi:hypothetical protein
MPSRYHTLAVPIGTVLCMLSIGAKDCTPGSAGSADVYCFVASAGECLAKLNLASDQVSKEESACTANLNGSLQSACPTSGLYGCCELTSAAGPIGYSCYYPPGDATAARVACSAIGTWSTTPPSAP